MSWLVAAFGTGMMTTVGALPFLWTRVSRPVYDTLLGFGAGLMLAAATLGLLGTALGEVRVGGHLDTVQLVLVLGGFLVGVFLLLLMDRLIPHVHAGGHHVHVHDDHVHPDDEAGETGQARCAHGHVHAPAAPLDAEAHNARKQGLLVVGAMSLHRLPEGFAIGAAYASLGRGLGTTLALAIAVQNAVEGAVMAVPLKRGGLGAKALLGLVSVTGLAVPLAAVAGYFLVTTVGGAMPLMLALAAGALLYLACNEVIPESHSHGNEVRATFGIIAGFVVVMLLKVLFGHTH